MAADNQPQANPSRDGVTRFRFAELDELRLLEDLQRRTAIAVGDYRQQILAHPDAIAIPAQRITDQQTRVAISAGRILGFSIVIPLTPETGELDGLFVEPELMGRGIGRALLQDAFSIAASRGLRRIEVTSNPRAIGFYERIGFVGERAVETRFDRALRMRLDLHEQQPSPYRVRSIQTERLSMVPIYLRDHEEMRVDADAFALRRGLTFTPGLKAFLSPPDRDVMVAIEWDGFQVVDQATQMVIGFCGCQKYASPAGEMEIAYGFAPEFQGKGMATEVARALVPYALRRPEVTTVIAHTLPEVNASGRVLTKAGFRQAGEALDPDEGRVWKWELRRP